MKYSWKHRCWRRERLIVEGFGRANGLLEACTRRMHAIERLRLTLEKRTVGCSMTSFAAKDAWCGNGCIYGVVELSGSLCNNRDWRSAAPPPPASFGSERGFIGPWDVGWLPTESNLDNLDLVYSWQEHYDDFRLSGLQVYRAGECCGRRALCTPRTSSMRLREDPTELKVPHPHIAW